jgi:hypothetical protein
MKKKKISCALHGNSYAACDCLSAAERCQVKVIVIVILLGVDYYWQVARVRAELFVLVPDLIVKKCNSRY